MKENIEITIGSRIITALIVLVIVGVGGFGLVKVISMNDAKVSGAGGYVVSGDPQDETVLTDSVEGVEVAVEDVWRVSGKTFVVMRMNNHRFDLSDPLMGERTSVDGVVSEGFRVLTSEMGGHHVTVEMSFDGELDGELVIGVTKDIFVRLVI